MPDGLARVKEVTRGLALQRPIAGQGWDRWHGWGIGLEAHAPGRRNCQRELREAGEGGSIHLLTTDLGSEGVRR